MTRPFFTPNFNVGRYEMNSSENEDFLTPTDDIELESRTVGLEFWLHPRHLSPEGRVEVKCTAVIRDVYHAETETFVVAQLDPPQHRTPALSAKSHSQMMRPTLSLLLCSILQIYSDTS